MPPNLTIEVGRLAVETGVFPLYEVIDGEYRLSLELPELKPVREYTKKQGRFRHLSDDAIERIQARVEADYARLKSKAGL